MRLLSHRPSVLAKLLPLAPGDRSPEFDIVGEGLEVSGPGWEDRLERMLAVLSGSERADLFAVSLLDELALPLPAPKLLAQARSAWFPQFLSHGRWVPFFQPVVELRSDAVLGHRAVMHGRLGTRELGPGELVSAARAHDALYSFDRRARMVALEAGLPLIPAHETLFVGLDPCAVVDLETSLSSTWPAVARVPGPRPAVCLELVASESGQDLGLLGALAAAHRERGASIALDDLSGAAVSLSSLEVVRPDFARLGSALIAGAGRSSARRRLAEGLVGFAHELGARVIVEGLESAREVEAARSLGVDCGQGSFFADSDERPRSIGALDLGALSGG